MKRKTIQMTVTVTVPQDMTAIQARREVRHLINEGAGWLFHAGEAVRAKKVQTGGRDAAAHRKALRESAK